MDFLTSAVSKFGIGSSAYSKDSPVDLDTNFPISWKVWQGTVRKDGTKCTVFEITDPAVHKHGVNFVNAIKKLRFPGLPRLIGAEESPTSIVVALERITPLTAHLQELSQTNRIWGLSNVLTTLCHLQSAKCVAGNTHLGTVWVNGTGDWVLTGFEVAAFSTGFPDCSRAAYLPYQANAPPEGWQQADATIDTFQFGKLAQQILPDCPPSLQRVISGCLQQQGRRKKIVQIDKGAFATPLQSLSENLAHFQMMNEYEFTQLLRDSASHIGDFSTQFISGRLIPALVQAYGANQRGGLELVRLVLHLAERASPSDQLTGFIVSLFSSLDRAVRVELLQLMPRYIKVVPERAVQRNIMPAMAVSFADSEPMIRRESLKSITSLAPKLNSRQLNGDLLRLLAKTNNDTQVDIRAETIRVLTRLAELMDKSTRSGVVVTALAKSLKDPAPEVRNASLEALVKTSSYFSAKECAEKLLGPAASSLLDSRYEVRSLGREIVQTLLDKITTESEKLDESLENGAPPPERVVSRDDTPSVAKLFKGDPEPTPVPPVPAKPAFGSASKGSPAPPAIVPKLSPPPGGAIVAETAVFTSSGWDDWDEEEEEDTQIPPVIKPVAVPQGTKGSIEPDLEPEDDGDDGWGDW